MKQLGDSYLGFRDCAFLGCRTRAFKVSPPARTVPGRRAAPQGPAGNASEPLTPVHLRAASRVRPGKGLLWDTCEGSSLGTLGPHLAQGKWRLSEETLLFTEAGPRRHLGNHGLHVAPLSLISSPVDGD